MTIPADVKRTLVNALKIYDEENYSNNYKRKAYIDDNVLIKKGVDIKSVINAFQLEKKKKYTKLLSQVNAKNNLKKIEGLKENKEQYKLFTLNYILNNYDYGYDKYNRLRIEEIEITYKYDVQKENYKKYSYTTGGALSNYNMTYIDLIDDTYNTIEKVVKKIKQLEEIL